MVEGVSYDYKGSKEVIEWSVKCEVKILTKEDNQRNLDKN